MTFSKVKNVKLKLHMKPYMRHQRSLRPDPSSRQERSLFSFESCFIYRDFEKSGRTTRVNIVITSGRV